MNYIAMSKLRPQVVAELVKGLAKGCKESSIFLVGGETAEMPGFYKLEEYDLVGFIVGVVEKKDLIEGKRIKPGNKLIGLASNGLHTNGYSLARKILFEKCGFRVHDHHRELKTTVGKELLKVHRSYARTILPLLDRFPIYGMAHITGGGFFENIPRILPPGCGVRINRESWEVPPIFKLLQEEGRVNTMEMYRTFNMGIGMVLVVPPQVAEPLVKILRRKGEKAYIIGEVVRGRREVDLGL